MRYSTLVASLAAALLFGCTTTGQNPAPIVPTVVNVPIEVKCKVPSVEKPTWPLQEANGSETIFDYVKKALAEIELRKAYETKLEAAIKVCQ